MFCTRCLDGTFSEPSIPGILDENKELVALLLSLWATRACSLSSKPHPVLNTEAFCFKGCIWKKCVNMVVKELLQWRAPPILILAVLLLQWNQRLVTTQEPALTPTQNILAPSPLFAGLSLHRAVFGSWRAVSSTS